MATKAGLVCFFGDTVLHTQTRVGKRVIIGTGARTDADSDLLGGRVIVYRIDVMRGIIIGTFFESSLFWRVVHVGSIPHHSIVTSMVWHP